MPTKTRQAQKWAKQAECYVTWTGGDCGKLETTHLSEWSSSYSAPANCCHREKVGQYCQNFWLFRRNKKFGFLCEILFLNFGNQLQSICRVVWVGGGRELGSWNVFEVHLGQSIHFIHGQNETQKGSVISPKWQMVQIPGPLTPNLELIPVGHPACH